MQRCVSRKAVREAAVEAHDAFLAHNLADAVHRVLVLAQVRLQSISHSTSNTNNMNKQLEAKNRHNANNMYRPLPEATERKDGWMDGWKAHRLTTCMCAVARSNRTDGWMEGAPADHMHVCRCPKQQNGWMDGWMDGRRIG